MVFVFVNAVSSLRAAVYVAIGAAALILVLRLVRREPTMQALGGFLGVAFCAVYAARTGDAVDYFLPGILFSGALGLLLLLTILAGRPAIGYAAAAVDGDLSGWRARPTLRRAAVLSTWAWVAVLALRFTVQGALYLADREGWLATARLSMTWPLTVALVFHNAWLFRRALARERLVASSS